MNEDIKAKIRERYRGKQNANIEVIPAIEQPSFYEDFSEKRVAVYARVSTGSANQTSSYELQKGYYEQDVTRHPGWKLVRIYADEGISGTSLNHRDEFIQMIKDCEAGKIDLIITKSVSRFSRNVLDCIGKVRKLAALPHPVGVFFETENIYTLNSDSEMSLSFVSTLAQEESHIKSDIMNASITMRFNRGILLTPALLGYDKDEVTGQLVINEEEAKTVKLIFFMYLYGNTCQQIAELLTEYGRKTKKGNTKWSAGSVLQILQNERHCGDVLTRKTWTPNYLDHKSKKNRQNLEQRRWKNQHEAIISRDNFIAVQRLISNAKYGNKGFLPELKVINEGALKGFVSINPRWAAFTAEDYISASASVYNNEDNENKIDVEVQTGDFDLRKYEVARSQFFDTSHKICVTFSNKNLLFNTECIRKFDKTLYVEMLINPTKKLFVVRPCNKECRNAVKWAKVTENGYFSRSLSAIAYIKTLYNIFEWNKSYKYRIRGIKKQKEQESIIIFDMTETEVFISQESDNLEPLSDEIKPFTTGPKKDIMAYPYDWAETFGNNYYRQAQIQELALLNSNEWKTKEEGISYNSEELDITSPEELHTNIENLKTEMQTGDY